MLGAFSPHIERPSVQTLHYDNCERVSGKDVPQPRK